MPKWTEIAHKLLQAAPDELPEEACKVRHVDVSYVMRCVPLAYRDASLDDFDGLTFDQRGFGYCLRGNPGIGKTHLAAAMMRHWIVKNSSESVGWYYTPYLFSRIRSTYSSSSYETERDIIEDLVSRDMIVLDDIGSTTSTDFSLQTTLTLLGLREQECKQTIVTTNLTLQQWDKIEPRIASRLAGMGTARLPDVDWRLKRRKEHD